MNKDIQRLRWSEFMHYEPLIIIIKDWKNLKTFYNNRYLLVPSAMQYKDRDVMLCVPYKPFVRVLRALPLCQQKWIVNGNAEVEIVKTYKWDRFGMVINKVTKI